MRYLPRPMVTARQSLDLCIASIRDKNLIERLKLATETVESIEAEYLIRGHQAELNMITGTQGVAGHVSTSEMDRVYENTFVRSRKTRHIYDSIKKRPENDICPLCGQRTVFTLDHYLPKSTHPVLAITPVNLVPACGECNKIKHEHLAALSTDQTMHPYFDYMDDDRWLFAKVQQHEPATLFFSPDPPMHWGDVKRQRVITHFKVFDLGKLYASHSAVELRNIRFALQKISENNPPQIVRDHLKSEADSRAAAHPNSWQRAAYAALVDSEWFWSGGFNY